MQGYPHMNSSDVIVMAERRVNRQDRPEGESVLLYNYVKKYYTLITNFFGWEGRGELKGASIDGADIHMTTWWWEWPLSWTQRSMQYTLLI